jgi:dTDP-4-dehydrorhamnose reductase
MTFVGRDQLDLANTESIEAYLSNHKYDVIINCAAYTAVDKAESEPGLADQINHLAVKQLAEIAKQQDTTLIHISTDYVFNGQNYKPYIESDSTDPQSVYGSTKLKGEKAIQASNPKGCIIRTSWVYSEFGNNFVKTMLRLGKKKNS